MRLLLVQNCEVESLGRYERHLAERRIPYDRVHAYRGEPLPDVASYDAFIVGGTPVSAYDANAHPFLAAELRFLEGVLASGKPCLGICCGGQMLAQLLGARVTRNPVMEIGVYEMRLTPAGRQDPILAGFPELFPAFEWHQDLFEVPSGARLLVEGTSCGNQMFRHGNAVGLLSHLEVDAGDAGRWTEAYANEIPRAGKGREDVLRECAEADARMAPLAERLLDNFFRVGGLPLVRSVTESDTPQALALVQEVYAEYGQRLNTDEEPWWLSPGPSFRESGGEFWVVEVGGLVRATAAVKLHEGDGELKCLYVHGSLRRQGWGLRLTELAMDHARRAGKRSFTLWSDTRFTEAHRLYASMGFRQTGLRDLHDSNQTREYGFEILLGERGHRA